MAILLRSVRKNGAAITRALDAAGIPYVVAGVNNLFGTSEAEAPRQLFHFMANRPTIDAAALEGVWLAAGLDWIRQMLERQARRQEPFGMNSMLPICEMFVTASSGCS